MSRKRNVTVAAVQMKCSTNVEENIAKADALVREAAEKGAQIILLPELFVKAGPRCGCRKTIFI